MPKWEIWKPAFLYFTSGGLYSTAADTSTSTFMITFKAFTLFFLFHGRRRINIDIHDKFYVTSLCQNMKQPILRYDSLSPVSQAFQNMLYLGCACKMLLFYISKHFKCWTTELRTSLWKMKTMDFRSDRSLISPSYLTIFLRSDRWQIYQLSIRTAASLILSFPHTIDHWHLNFMANYTIFNLFNPLSISTSLLNQSFRCEFMVLNQISVLDLGSPDRP